MLFFLIPVVTILLNNARRQKNCFPVDGRVIDVSWVKALLKITITEKIEIEFNEEKHIGTKEYVYEKAKIFNPYMQFLYEHRNCVFNRKRGTILSSGEASGNSFLGDFLAFIIGVLIATLIIVVFVG